jgi:hypothetical protein
VRGGILVLVLLCGCLRAIPAYPQEVRLPVGGAWSSVKRGGITLHHVSSDSVLAGHVLRELEEGRTEVANRLGDVPAGEAEVYLATSGETFRILTGGRVPHWGVGVAFPRSGTIVLLHRPGEPDALFQTIRHELSHILLHAAVSAAPEVSPPYIPVWFNEGVALWAAGQWRFGEAAEVTYAVLAGSLLPLTQIDAVLDLASPRAQLAYSQSYLAILFLIEVAGPHAVAEVVEALSAGTPFDVALYRVSGLTPAGFEQAYRDRVRARYGLRGLLSSPEALWGFMLLGACGVWAALRARNRSILRRWATEDPLDALPARLKQQVLRRRDGR